MMRRLVGLTVLACLCTGSAFAQGQYTLPEPNPDRFTRPEVLRLFDAYAVVHAQEALGLDNARYGSFVAAYKSLLETRRRNREQRVRMLNELGRMATMPTPDEPALRDRLKSMQDFEVRAASEAAQAIDAVDQVLTVTERIRFRVFEERMEQRKLELLSRARAVRDRRGQQRQ